MDDQESGVFDTIEKAIKAYNTLNQDVLSADHDSGTCIVFFKGDADKAVFVRKIIEKLNRLEAENSITNYIDAEFHIGENEDG